MRRKLLCICLGLMLFICHIALAETDAGNSRLLYLYTPACENCAIAEQVLEDLPETVTVTLNGRTFESTVIQEKLDISQEPDMAYALFETYQVPDGQRVTPILFLGHTYLSGADAISTGLMASLQRGDATYDLLDVSGTDTAPASSGILTSIASGLVAGLNTCALSMLLLFLSLLLSTDRNAVPAAVAYLGAKFVCYMLIGTVLTALMQRLNPTVLKPVTRWIMTVLGGILILLNLSDALQATRGNLAQVHNQLPSGVRGRLHGWIHRMTASRAVIPASIALGFLVAAGEFMCAGQLYLMQLMQSVLYDRGQLLSLFLYCIAFLFPSVIVTCVVLAGRSHLRAARFFAAHMALVKLLTALVMVVLIVLAWII